MADIASFQPKNRPRLPVEVCERIIDMLAGSYDFYAMGRSSRRSLNSCRLVCRDWVPRCRFHLFDEVSVFSRDSLQAVATFLRTSSFHADRVRTLKIYGGGPDQSWISTVPLSIPKLRRLNRLDLVAVSFLQQPPNFYQVYSYLRTTSQSKYFIVYVDEDFLRKMPARVSTLAALLRISQVRVLPNNFYPVHTLAEATSVQSWRQKLTSCTRFATRSSLQALHQFLPAWTFPVGWWEITMQTSVRESLGELLQETRRVWEKIARVFALSIIARPGDVHIEFYVAGLGSLELNAVKYSEPVEYGLWAYLDNADDSALAYLSHILPCVASCNLTSIQFRIKHNWSASTQMWQMVDDALLSLARGSVSRVVVMVDPSADVPSWEALPYECVDELCKEVLPRCVARGLICMFCEKSVDPDCMLHDPRRRPGHGGTIEDMENGGEGRGSSGNTVKA